MPNYATETYEERTVALTPNECLFIIVCTAVYQRNPVEFDEFLEAVECPVPLTGSEQLAKNLFDKITEAVGTLPEEIPDDEVVHAD